MSKVKVTSKALFEFCAFYRQQFGQIQDATRFKNELGLRFYFQSPNASELFEQCVELKFIRHDAGNVIIKVGGKNDGQ